LCDARLRKVGKQVLQDEYLLFSRHKAIYDQIRYLDAGGRAA